jgi:hypothetical protein
MKPLPIPMFVDRLEDGNYLMNVEIGSHYLRNDRTRDRAAAHPLNDFDSQLVLKRLCQEGEKNARREEVKETP